MKFFLEIPKEKAQGNFCISKILESGGTCFWQGQNTLSSNLVDSIADYYAGSI
jgi:hypothetical protein